MMLRILLALLFFVVCLADDLETALVLVLDAMAMFPLDLFVVTVVTHVNQFGRLYFSHFNFNFIK